MNKLELYAIALVVMGLAFGGAYFKGRHDEASAIHKAELAADAAALEKANAALVQRAAADDAARTRAEEFITLVDGGLSRVQQKFGHLPQVVVDARGCSDLAPAFGLRWNAAAGSLSGAPGPPAGAVDPAGVRPEPVPATGRPL
jgi:hypothetical protein